MKINPEFLIWWNTTSIFEIVLVVIATIIVSLPFLFFTSAFMISIFTHKDSINVENNDCGWL